MAHGFEMTIDFSQESQELTSMIAATTKQLETAANRAMVKVAKWLRVHSLRELGQELGVNQEPLKKRFKLYPKRKDGKAIFWVGLQPIEVHRLGKPKMTRQGVRVNKKDYQGAFISPMKTDKPLVFKRRGSERLPIDLVKEEFADDALAIIHRWERRINSRFKEIFNQEAQAILNGYV